VGNIYKFGDIAGELKGHQCPHAPVASGASPSLSPKKKSQVVSELTPSIFKRL